MAAIGIGIGIIVFVAVMFVLAASDGGGENWRG